MSTYLNYDSVVDQLQAAGLILPATLVIGKRQRTHIDGKDREKRGWYSLFEFRTDDGEYLISGAYGVWSGNDNGKRKIELSELGKKISAEQMAANRERIKAEQKRAEAEEKAKQARAAAEAAAMWSRLNHEGECEYLQRKGVAGHGVRYTAQGNMALPMIDERGAIHGLQVIYADKAKGKKGRDKDFWPAGVAKKGHWFQIGMPDWIALVAEGYATAASLHEATGLPVIVAFDAGNLLPVAQAIHKRYPRAKLLICGDDDYASAGNPGITAANAAAVAVSGAWVAPVFAAERPAQKGGPTDFNDLHALEGLHIVRQQIEARLTELGWRRRDPSALADAGGEGKRSLLVSSVEDVLARYVLVYGANGMVFDRQERILVKIDDIRHACLGRDIVKNWLEDSRRQAVLLNQVGFDPAGTDPKILCNLWGGWPTVPKQGQCSSLLEILEYMSAEEDNASEVYQWMLRWLAYPIQHPGAKMKTALVIHGPQGGGKNLFFEAVRDIYGRYGISIDQSALEDKHNDWAEKKLFIIADEVIARNEMHHTKNKLKSFITSGRLRINPKHVMAHDEENHVNIVFLSNEAQPLALERDDRRHLVVWMPPSMPHSYFANAIDELQNGGVAALHHYLLNIDLGDFNPGSRPPDTRAKQRLISIGADSADAFMDEWLSESIGSVPSVPAPVEAVYSLYRKWAERNGHRFIHTRQAFSGRATCVRGVTKRERMEYFLDGAKKQVAFLFPPNADQGSYTNSYSWLTDTARAFSGAAEQW